MTPRVVWTPVAEEGLEEILYYIAVEDGRPETARRLGEEILAAVDRHFQLRFRATAILQCRPTGVT